MGEQPIFTVKAHVYHIDRQTRKTWVMVSKIALPVSFFFDTQRNLYRIISVESTRAVINSIVTNSTIVKKTSNKFVQWADQRTDVVYGVGFAAESDLLLFVEKFQEIKLKAEQQNSTINSGLLPGSRPESATILKTTSRRPPRCSSALAHGAVACTATHLRSNSNEQLPALPTLNEHVIGNDAECDNNNPPIRGNFIHDIDHIRSENRTLVEALRKSAENVKKWEQELLRLREENRLLKQQHQPAIEPICFTTKPFNSLPSTARKNKESRSRTTQDVNFVPNVSAHCDVDKHQHRLKLRDTKDAQESVPPEKPRFELDKHLEKSIRDQLRSTELVYDQVLRQSQALHSILQDGRRQLVCVIADADALAASSSNNYHAQDGGSSSIASGDTLLTTVASENNAASTFAADMKPSAHDIKKEPDK